MGGKLDLRKFMCILFRTEALSEHLLNKGKLIHWENYAYWVTQSVCNNLPFNRKHRSAPTRAFKNSRIVSYVSGIAQ